MFEVATVNLSLAESDLLNKNRIGDLVFPPTADFSHERHPVIKGTWKDQSVAIKEVLVEPDTVPEEFIPEMSLSRSLYRRLREVIVGLTLPVHNNLCRVHGWGTSSDGTRLYVVMEAFDDDLYGFLLKSVQRKPSPYEGGPLGWEGFFSVTTEVVQALKCLESLPMNSDDSAPVTYCVHRDLKLENIFVKYEEVGTPAGLPRVARVALGDFGAARFGGTDPLTWATVDATGHVGTSFYEPPEVQNPDQFKGTGPDSDFRLTPKLDIYSLGIVMCRLLQPDLAQLPDEPRFDCVPYRKVVRLMRSCSARHPSDRLSCADVLAQLDGARVAWASKSRGVRAPSLVEGEPKKGTQADVGKAAEDQSQEPKRNEQPTQNEGKPTEKEDAPAAEAKGESKEGDKV